MKFLAEKNLSVRKENQNKLRELEQFYNEGKIDNLPQIIEEKKKELVKDMIKYKEEHTIPSKFDRYGKPLSYKVDINPYVISNYFFKSVTSISSQEPLYNAEKLGLVFDYYCQILGEVNDKIGQFPSSLTLFCKFAGITLSTLGRYKNSDDYNMRVIVEKIYDQVGDENITMAQLGKVKERSTMFKMKTQNEMTEKNEPSVKINVNKVEIDLDKINEKINKYNSFIQKRSKENDESRKNKKNDR